jgi:hypothetical protein
LAAFMTASSSIRRLCVWTSSRRAGQQSGPLHSIQSAPRAPSRLRTPRQASRCQSRTSICPSWLQPETELIGGNFVPIRCLAMSPATPTGRVGVRLPAGKRGRSFGRLLRADRPGGSPSASRVAGTVEARRPNESGVVPSGQPAGIAVVEAQCADHGPGRTVRRERPDDHSSCSPGGWPLSD